MLEMRYLQQEKEKKEKKEKETKKQMASGM